MPDDHQNAGEEKRNHPQEPVFSPDTVIDADPLSHDPDVQATLSQGEIDAAIIDAGQLINVDAAENSDTSETNTDNNNATLPVSAEGDRTVIVEKYKGGAFPHTTNTAEDSVTLPVSAEGDRTVIVEKDKGSIPPTDPEDDANNDDFANTVKRPAIVISPSQPQVQIPTQEKSDASSDQDAQEQQVASVPSPDASSSTDDFDTQLDFVDSEEQQPEVFLNTNDTEEETVMQVNHTDEVEADLLVNEIEETKTVALPDIRVNEIEETKTVALSVPLQSAYPIEARNGKPGIEQSYIGIDFAGSYLGSSIPSTRSTEYSLRHRKVLLRHISRKRLRQDRFNEKRSASRFWTTILSTVATLVLILLILIGGGSYAGYVFYSQTRATYAPKINGLRALMPLDNLKMYDTNGVFLDQMADRGLHTSVKLSQVSKDLINATVTTEDKSFWDNPGIDINRILQSAIDDLSHGRVVEGGSTITQQLIKNLVISDQNQTVLRKLQEIMLTPDINTHYSKSDIMEMYVNSIYYGHQATGIDAAAMLYFGLEDQPGKPASAQLTLAQSAMLAGIPNSPSAYDPWQHPVAAFNRFQVVLELMVRNNNITRAQAQEAITEEKSPNFLKSPTDLLQNRAPHFVEFVLQQLEKVQNPATGKPFTRYELSLSGMSVYTTLDISLQDKIQAIMQSHIADLKAHNASNAAEVLIDFHTGAIISLLGSIDTNNVAIDGQFDVATDGYRQPGSSFKPFVYATAFEQGIGPGQAIDDSRLNIPQPYGQKPYAPTNYDLRYHGPMTLRCALQNSLNVPAVKVLQHAGVDASLATAKSMGIESTQGTPGLSLVLGGLGVHLVDQTSAYGTFADGGVHVPYYEINKIVFPSTGQTVTHSANAGTQAISPQIAYMITNTLSDNTSRLPEFYDCNVLQLFDGPCAATYGRDRGTVRPAAAKTGTTNSFRDNWTMGYTTDFVMGVWAGNNDNTPMINITGVAGAAPIWHDSMLLAEQGHPVQNFTEPSGLQTATVVYPDGVTSTDLYLQGKVPSFNISKSSGSKDSTGMPGATSTTGPHGMCATFSDTFGPINTGKPDGGSSLSGVW